MDEFVELLEKGDPDAQFEMVFLHFEGAGVDKDFTKARD
jgi:hypothetical protein